MRIFAPHAVDFYKTGHHRMLPAGTEHIYSNLTPRADGMARQLADTDHRMVFFGLQRFIAEFLIDQWNETFFRRPEAEVIEQLRRRIDGAIGPGSADVDGFRALHRLGYLPIRIKALPEGSRVPLRVPALTVVNTHPGFPWLTNYLESVLLADLWKPCVNASLAFEFRRMLQRAAMRTVGDTGFVPFQGHDFSMRGMSGHVDAANSGVAHLTCFVGTDTVAAIDVAERFYGDHGGDQNSNGAEGERFGSAPKVIGVSVPATEHMVMCIDGQEHEFETYRRLIQDVHPRGLISIVSDTWDYFQVLDDYTRRLREVILAREPDAAGFAKVVFRPDSGDPARIICGDPDAPENSPQRKGSAEILWDIFGGTRTAKGYRLLHERVGLIYGDAITLERAEAIIVGLEARGFASTNVVFGIGSFSYQLVMRDSFGMAVKATWAQVDGAGRILMKDPRTAAGAKRSAAGLLRVEEENGSFVLHDRQTPEQERGGALRPVFEDGRLLVRDSLRTIRARLAAQLF
ncbi:MAG: nicotinate phosphoribosyltransferase [Gluconacetobacter diazotrophicus]|nr:nicotinate phosphoribosyltransferase [Gluconacetobacter diazotrophicus]